MLIMEIRIFVYPSLASHSMSIFIIKKKAGSFCEFFSFLRTFHALIKSLYTYERVLKSSQSDKEPIPLIILMFDQILESGLG